MTLEFPWITFLPVVQAVDMDVEEDILSKLGDIGPLLESSLVMEMETITGVNHTSCHHVDFLAHPKRLLPQLVQPPVTLTILDNHMLKLSTREKASTKLLRTLLLSKLKL